jgi:hypothetical protein
MPALNEAGLQPWKGGALEPRAILKSLVGKHGKALSWERNLEAIISEDSGACVLRCRGCDGEFSATNPHYVMQTHVAACKAPLRTSPRDLKVCISAWTGEEDGLRHGKPMALKSFNCNWTKVHGWLACMEAALRPHALHL